MGKEAKSRSTTGSNEFRARGKGRNRHHAATGIGKAIAFAFGAAGARVVVNHLDTPDPADAAVGQISREDGEALAVAADISSRVQFEAQQMQARRRPQ